MLRAAKAYALLALAAGGVLGGAAAQASDYIGPNGSSWSVPGNWNPFGVPSGSATSANISLAPATPFNVFMNFNYSAGTALASLNVNSSTASMLTLTMNGAANLYSGDELIGTSGKGTFEQSSATNSVSGGLLVGYNPGSTGIYNLSNTGNVYVNVYETIGLAGNGSFNQNAGVNTVGTAGSGQFRVAEQSVLGNYNLSGSGSFIVNGSAWIGHQGNGTFTQSGGTAAFNGPEIIGYVNASTGNYTQSGGTHTVGTPSASADLTLAVSSASSATYALSGTGSLTLNGNEFIGASGAAAFTQSGGTHAIGSSSIDRELHLGESAGSSGSYNLSGAGSLTVSGNEVIGVSGAGTFTQSGGTHTTGSPTHQTFFHLGRNAGSSGSYDLSGGNLNVYSLEEFGIGGPATFTQSGGTHTVGIPARNSFMALGMNSTATYTLSGTGVLQIYGFEIIGRQGPTGVTTGIFNQTGGTHTIGVPTANGASLQLGADHSASGGSYNLSGGDLIVNGSEIIGTSYGPGTFTQSGGTNTAGTPLFPRGLVVGSSALGSYALSGTSSLRVIGDETIQHGTFTQSGGTHTVSGIEWINFNWDASFTLSGGTHTIGTPSVNSELRIGGLSAGTGTYNLSGNGNLLVNGSESIGYRTGTLAFFNQSGGIQSVTGGVFVGGSISAAVGTGTLNISDGTANAGSLKIWDSGAAAPGGTRVNLSGGTLSVGTLDITANPSRFNWTGGTLNFTNGVVVDVGGPLGASVNLTTGMTLASSGGTLSNNGTITLNGGSLGESGLVSNQGLIVGNGIIGGYTPFDNFGDLRPVGIITLATTAAKRNFGEIDITTGNTLRMGESPLVNFGTVRLSGGLLSGFGQLSNFYGGTITGRGTISGAILGTNLGNIAVSDGTLNIATQFVNVGVIQMAGVAGTLAGGTITNLDGGTIQGFGNVNNAITNTDGTIEAIGGTLLLNATGSSSSGLIAVSTGNKLLFTQGLASSAGIISLAGGTFDNGGKAISNTGQISGFGVFRSGGLTNNGSITFAGGTTTINGSVVNAATNKIEVKFAPAVFTGAFTNNGIFKSTGAQVTFAATYTENGQFISDPATNFFENVLIGPDGAWTGGLGDRFIVGESLINQSDAKYTWETSLAELSFIGGSSHTYAAAGTNLGATFAGYDDNFAWGRLVVGAADSLNFEGEALYVGVLQLPGGVGSVSGSGTIYYDLRQPENDGLAGKTYQLAGGGAIAPVPEPVSAVGITLLATLACFSGGRRRR